MGGFFRRYSLDLDPCASRPSDPILDCMRLLGILCLLVGCSDASAGSTGFPVLGITDPTCTWVEREAVEAGEQCIRLVPGEGAETRFLAEDDTSCSGSACLLLRPGERGVVIGPLDVGYADYDLSAGDCRLLTCTARE